MGGALRYLLQVASTVRRTSSTYISTATLQSYPAHSHITSHGVAVVSTYFNIVGQDSDQSLVYKDGLHHSFRHRQFECLLPRASSEHSIIRSSTSYF